MHTMKLGADTYHQAPKSVLICDAQLCISQIARNPTFKSVEIPIKVGFSRYTKNMQPSFASIPWQVSLP
jgi:hypothetical protein